MRVGPHVGDCSQAGGFGLSQIGSEENPGGKGA